MDKAIREKLEKLRDLLREFVGHDSIKQKKEKKTVREWCKTCIFNEVIINGKKYLVSRDANPKTPTYLDCLTCLYEAVLDMKITKPKNWRK